MNDLGSKLRLACYEAPDGPRIMLFGPLNAQFGDLRELLERLANGAETSVALHQQPFVAAFGGIEVMLSAINFGGDAVSEGVRREQVKEKPIYHWANQRQKWLRYAQLVDGLLKAAAPCHQYLSTFPTEDAIVVVSKGEYKDDVLTCGEADTSISRK